MRITQETKERNRKKILSVATDLFRELGYEKTTTRDISKGCNMGKGTLFNYFPSKETLAMSLVAEAMEEGRCTYLERRSGKESLEEDMFLFVASELRALRPFRTYIGPVLESTMSVFAKNSSCPEGERARKGHLQTVAAILAGHNYQMNEDSIAVTLYWSLYLGILAHWSRDDSEHQQQSLALVDYSMKVFGATVTGSIGGEKRA